MSRRITIIIPTMFTKDLTRLVRALGSFTQADTRNYSLSYLVVVNSAPVDTSSEIIRRKIFAKSGTDCDVLVSPANKGFAPAINDGILYARAATQPDWYLIVNDDATVHRDFFTRLQPQFTTNRYDAISCGVEKSDGRIESIGLRYDVTGLAFPRTFVPDTTDSRLFTGTCVALSKKRVEKEITKHGYILNPLFFAYAEDLELSLRILSDRGKIYISNDVLITHAGSKTAKRGSFFQLYHGYRNLILVVLLLWSWKDTISRLPALFLGQFFIIIMSVYKQHYLLYPTIWWWIIKHWQVIIWQRNHYAQR